jgi:hypothetical protein
MLAQPTTSVQEEGTFPTSQKQSNWKIKWMYVFQTKIDNIIIQNICIDNSLYHLKEGSVEIKNSAKRVEASYTNINVNITRMESVVNMFIGDFKTMCDYSYKKYLSVREINTRKNDRIHLFA